MGSFPWVPYELQNNPKFVLKSQNVYYSVLHVILQQPNQSFALHHAIHILSFHKQMTNYNPHRLQQNNNNEQTDYHCAKFKFLDILATKSKTRSKKNLGF